MTVPSPCLVRALFLTAAGAPHRAVLQAKGSIKAGEADENIVVRGDEPRA
ncbi:hypothetical protein [Streptomyces sp. NPDC008137]